MKIGDDELRARMAVANHQMLRKFKVISLIIALIFLFCLAFNETSTIIARWSATYVPSIAKLIHSPTTLGDLPARFFGMLAVLMPAFVVWLAWGEDPRMRWRYGAKVSGRGRTEFLLMLYLLGVPFSIFFIFMMYASPIEMPATPRLWGQHIVHLMLNTSIGLLVLGGIAALATVVAGALSLIYLALPFATIKHAFFKGSK